MLPNIASALHHVWNGDRCLLSDPVFANGIASRPKKDKVNLARVVVGKDRARSAHAGGRSADVAGTGFWLSLLLR